MNKIKKSVVLQLCISIKQCIHKNLFPEKNDFINQNK